MAEYIKCSKCKCKSINDEEHINQDFGYNRIGNRYRSCKKCRNIPDNTCLTQQHYDGVDRELRALYEKEFGMSSKDTTHKFFTEEEQIERYAKMSAFWEKNMPDLECLYNQPGPREMAKVFYISDMRNQLHRKIIAFNEETQRKINERRNELLI
jgi:hypothetical protein